MKLNIYKVTPGKPMVYNLDSAKSFLEQTKEPCEIRVSDPKERKFLLIYGGKVELVIRDYCSNIGIDTVIYESNGEQAERDIYKLRKYINRHFNR